MQSLDEFRTRRDRLHEELDESGEPLTTVGKWRLGTVCAAAFALLLWFLLAVLTDRDQDRTLDKVIQSNPP